MDVERFEAVLRALSPAASRRGVLAGLAGGLLVSLPRALGVDEAAARKKGKKKKKSPPPAPPPLTCAQRCPAFVASCLHRPEGAPLCSSGYGFDCKSCATDQDCLQVVGEFVKPYCITAITDRDSGDTTRTVGPGTSCPGPSVGQCASVFAP
ncbi:MAG: hypothetical protein M3Q50_01250 [Chloroflexota bacterium]|nr:hypothetical protein [Chloroflexota bacterium]